jgi:tripartite motif-containing protein 71
MRRVSALFGLVIVSLIFAPMLAAAALQPAIAPDTTSAGSSMATASPAVAPELAELVRTISLGTDSSSAAAGLAVDAAGTLYVIDSLQNHISVFDPDGRLVATWGTSGSGPGQFRFQSGGGIGFWGDLAIGPDGNLYIVDPFNDRVQVLAPDGTFLRSWGEQGKEAGQFDGPSGIAVDRTGRVYVTEFGNRRLQVFDPQGHALASWTLPKTQGGPFEQASDVAVDATGTVLVTDSTRAHIDRFDAAGTHIDGFGEQGAKLGQFFSPWGIAVDAAGNVYVAEYGGSRVQVLAPDGTPLGTIGAFGQPGQLSTPIYLTVGPDGLLYVADEGQHHVQVFRLLAPLSAAPATPAPA